MWYERDWRRTPACRVGTRADACPALASLHATTFYVTVAGLGGEPDYEQRFTSQAQEIDKLVALGNPDAKVTTLFGPQATQSPNPSHALGNIAKEAKPADALVVMLIGHGSFDGVDYKINLPGPGHLRRRTRHAARPHSRHAPTGREHDQRQRRLARGARKDRAA